MRKSGWSWSIQPRLTEHFVSRSTARTAALYISNTVSMIRHGGTQPGTLDLGQGESGAGSAL